MPDVKSKITDSANKGIEILPEAAQSKAKEQFTVNQDGYADKVTHAFSNSLRTIFITATVLVFAIKERPLRSAKPDETPGEA